MVHLGKEDPRHCIKDLNIQLTRIPFQDCTNKSMMPLGRNPSELVKRHNNTSTKLCRVVLTKTLPNINVQLCGSSESSAANNRLVLVNNSDLADKPDSPVVPQLADSLERKVKNSVTPVRHSVRQLQKKSVSTDIQDPGELVKKVSSNQKQNEVTLGNKCCKVLLTRTLPNKNVQLCESSESSAAKTKENRLVLVSTSNSADKSDSSVVESQKQKDPVINKVKNSVTSLVTSVRQSVPLKNRLRKCDKYNYFESTLEPSTVIENVSSPILKPKIPIYRQNVSLETKKIVKDPYELDICDPKELKIKKSHRKLNSSRKFDKTMFDVLEKLEKADKKPRRKVQEIKPGKYEKTIDNTLKKVMNKINDRKKACTSQEKVAINVNSESTKKGEAELISTELYSTGKAMQVRNIDNAHRKVLNKINDRRKASTSQEESGNMVKNVNSKSTKQDAVDLINNKSVPTKNAIQNQSIVYIESINGYETNNGFLGFDNLKNASTATSVQSPSVSRINIISDVNVTNPHSPSSHHNDSDSHTDDTDSDKAYFGFSDDDDDIIDSSAFFAQRRPNANSTMIGNRSKSPWRITALMRRPYLLSLKSSALPNLQQEMILNHTIVEDIEKHYSNKSVSGVSNQKLPVQTTMLDYVASSVDHSVEHNQENLANSSLFDYEEFNVSKPRRRVLGTLQDCSLSDGRAISTPLSRVGSNFGFDTTDDVNKENQLNSAKPYRLDLAGVKMYKNASVNNETLEASQIPTLVEEQANTDDGIESNTDVHLFDDVEKKFEAEMTIKMPKLKYQRKPRRKRLQSHTSDDEEDRPKKKKKDMMTKAEKAAFEKWAKDFNSMCDEVDQHDLEIE